jgi:hypothetical protein
MNKTLGWMVDENNTLIGPNGNISVSWRGEVAPCPVDAICSVGMDNGLVLIFLFTFFLGILGGWFMHIYSSRIQSITQTKTDTEILEDPRWDKGATIEGEHEYSPNCEVYGCDGQHV